MGKLSMNYLDEMFLNQNERTYGTIEELSPNELVPFKEHTFEVLDNEEMDELAKSVKAHGVMMPAIVFKNEDEQLEIVSGHRRTRACQLAGIEKIPCIVRNIDRVEASIIMIETNLQSRSNIKISEKAKSYKLLLESLKKQGKRNDLIDGLEETTEEAMVKKTGDSMTQIRRLIRLNELIPEILQLLDDNIMALRPGIEISYINPDNQKLIYDYYKQSVLVDDKGKVIYKGITPSIAQAKELRKLDKADELDSDAVARVLSVPKPNQREKIVIRDEHILKRLGNINPLQAENLIQKALDYYFEHMKHKENDVIR